MFSTGRVSARRIPVPRLWLVWSLLLTSVLGAGGVPAAGQGPPFMRITKTGTLDLGTDGVATPGDVIAYELEVINLAQCPIEDIRVSDSLIPSIICPSGNPIPSLRPGSETCTGSYTITQDDIDTGFVYNSARATGFHCVYTVGAYFGHLQDIPPLNQAPVALCSDVTVAAGLDCTAEASIDNGSHDPDGDEITLTQEPSGPYGLGEANVVLTVSDGSLEDACQARVTVRDQAAPFVSCNAPPSISPWEVPVSFTATGTDNCGLRRVLVRKPTCHWDWGNDIVQIYGQDTCDVVTQGDTITILNPGRSTEIRWLAVAIDQSGNRIVRHCSVDVVSELPTVGQK